MIYGLAGSGHTRK